MKHVLLAVVAPFVLAACTRSAAPTEAETGCKAGTEAEECLVAVSETFLRECQETAYVEMKAKRDPDHAIACIKQGREQIHSTLRAYQPTLDGRRLDAFKQYGATAIASLMAIAPSEHEIVIAYNARQAKNITDLRFQGERLKLR